jgi:hypothetical protein
LRRSQNDSRPAAHPVRNLITNPELVADVSDKLLFKNAVTNPSFETAGSTFDLWVNNVMNPSFRTTNGTTNVRKNLALNPSFEATGAEGTVRTNLVPYGSFEAASGNTSVRTNYSANPSMETAGSAVVVRTNLALNPSAASTSNWSAIGGTAHSRTLDTTVFKSGTSGVRHTLSAAGQLGAKGTISGGITSGETLCWSVWVYPSVDATFQAYWERTSPTYSGSALPTTATLCPANTWTQLKGAYTFSSAQADASGLFGFGIYASPTTFAIGDWFTVDELLVERVGTTSALGTFFDGGTSASTDFTYAWTGTANASSSEKRGLNVSLRTGLPPNGVSWQSSEKVRTGSKSAAVLLNYQLSDNATLWYPAGDYTVGTGAGQLPANTYITWSVYVYIPTGSSAKVGLMDVTSGIRGTASADIFDRWQRISLTILTPASGTVFLRLRTSGTVPAGSLFWVDDEMIEVGMSPTAYFDGSNPIQNMCTNPSFTTNTSDYTTISSSLTRFLARVTGLWVRCLRLLPMQYVRE